MQFLFTPQMLIANVISEIKMFNSNAVRFELQIRSQPDFGAQIMKHRYTVNKQLNCLGSESLTNNT